MRNVFLHVFLLFLAALPALAQPQITTRRLPKAQLGQPYLQSLSAIGGTPPYTYSTSGPPLPRGITLSRDGSLSGTPNELAIEYLDFTVTDSRGLSSDARIELATARGNLIFDQAILPFGAAGQTYTAQIPAPAGGSPPYRFAYLDPTLANNPGISPSGLLSIFPPGDAGFAFIKVKVEDSAGNAAAAYVNYSFGSQAPTLRSGTLPAGIVSSLYRQNIGSMGANERVSIGFGPSLPAGLSLSDSGLITGTPLAAGNYRFNVNVRNTVTFVPSVVSFLLTIIPPFTLSSASTLNLSVANPFTYNITLNGGFAPFRYEISSGLLPPGLTLSSTGTISGTATQTGTYTANIRVSDLNNSTAEFSFNFLVSDNRLSLAFPQATPPAVLYQPYRLAPTITGGRPPYTSSLSGGLLPSGLSFDATTGTLSGTPLFPAATSLTLRTRDSAANTVELPLTLNIAPPLRLASADVNLPYSLNLRSLPAFAGLSSFSLPADTIPGLALTNDGQLLGTPTAQGEYAFTINGIAVNLWVAPANRQIQPFFLPPAIEGQRYQQSLSTLGLSLPLQWTLFKGTLPAGLTLNASTGTLEGIPTRATTEPLILQASDSFTTLRASYHLTVSPATTPHLNFIGSAASFDGNGVAQGEILTAFGLGLGPTTLTSATLQSNTLPSTLAGLWVHFDSLPSPILYAQANQLSFIAPFAIPAFSPLRVVVESATAQSAPYLLLPRLAKPALFTFDGTGRGPAALLNEDGSINSATNPAEPGSIIVLYLTGTGPMNPPGRDGVIATTTSTLIAPASARINNQAATILYLGNAPGLVQGVAQANLRLPAGTIFGANPISITIGGNTTSSPTTVWIR
jgi:uncharacterized protein (TIGR03437 family)